MLQLQKENGQPASSAEVSVVPRKLSVCSLVSTSMEWHEKTCRRLDLADFGDGTFCLSCGSVRPAHPILPPIKQPSDIRILRVLPGPFDDDVECEIETEDLSKDINYEAISYTWADETGDASHCRTISLSGQPFKVTKNAEMALKRVRRQYSTRNIWIDAICINQDDVSERGHQVGLMPRIYSGAKTVLMYVGEISIFSPAVQGMAVHSILDIELSTSRPYWIELLSTRYFSRLWVLQEVALARKAILMYGEQSLSWSTVRDKAEYWNLNGLPPVFHFDYKAYSTPEQVIDLLWLAKSCDASDPRDKVFALFGLLPSRRIGNLEADYSLTVEDVYTRVALQLASMVGWCRVLFYAGKSAQKGSELSELSSLPSWVPDWSAPASPYSTSAFARSLTNNKEMPQLNVSYNESNKSISLRLLYMPHLETNWHCWEQFEAQFITEHLWFPLFLSNEGSPKPAAESLDALLSSKPTTGNQLTRDGMLFLLRQIYELYQRNSHDLMTDPLHRVSLRRLDIKTGRMVANNANNSNTVAKIDSFRHSLISLDCQEYVYSEFACIPISVVVQMFTIKQFPDWISWVLPEMDRVFFYNSHEGDGFDYSLMNDASKLLDFLRRWTISLEPTAAELEGLWMETYMSGGLVLSKPENMDDSSSDASSNTSSNKAVYKLDLDELGLDDEELRISINDEFWRLLVRYFSMRDKTIEIV